MTESHERLLYAAHSCRPWFSFICFVDTFGLAFWFSLLARCLRFFSFFLFFFTSGLFFSMFLLEFGKSALLFHDLYSDDFLFRFF